MPCANATGKQNVSATGKLRREEPRLREQLNFAGSGWCGSSPFDRRWLEARAP
jgi:hypothetical protein